MKFRNADHHEYSIFVKRELKESHIGISRAEQLNSGSPPNWS